MCVGVKVQQVRPTRFCLLIIGYRCVDTLAKIRYRAHLQSTFQAALMTAICSKQQRVSRLRIFYRFHHYHFSHEFVLSFACCLAQTQPGKCRSSGDFISTRLSVRSRSSDQQLQMVATRGSFSSVLSSFRFDLINENTSVITEVVFSLIVRH